MNATSIELYNQKFIILAVSYVYDLRNPGSVCSCAHTNRQTNSPTDEIRVALTGYLQLYSCIRRAFCPSLRRDVPVQNCICLHWAAATHAREISISLHVSVIYSSYVLVD